MQLRRGAVLTIAFAGGALNSSLAYAQLAQIQSKAGVIGTWSGHVTQVGAATGYSVRLTVRDGDGETDYPELNCGGKLRRVGSGSGYVFFTEMITRGRADQGGKCIDGSITIARAGERMSWGWLGSHQGKTYVAYATLSRN